MTAVFFQPMPMLLVAGQMLGHQGPKMPGMIFFLNMAKLMNDHIFQHFGRRHDQQPIDIDVIMDAATAPAAFLSLDPD